MRPINGPPPMNKPWTPPPSMMEGATYTDQPPSMIVECYPDEVLELRATVAVLRDRLYRLATICSLDSSCQAVSNLGTHYLNDLRRTEPKT